MKRLILILTIISILSIFALVYAQGPGMMGQGGYGMGPGMMGPGYGGYGMGPGMMAPGYGGWGEHCQKFFDETANLRKDLHNKRFEYSEAIRNPQSTPESVVKLGKEIQQLQEKVYSKAPQGCLVQ